MVEGYLVRRTITQIHGMGTNPNGWTVYLARGAHIKKPRWVGEDFRARVFKPRYHELVIATAIALDAGIEELTLADVVRIEREYHVQQERLRIQGKRGDAFDPAIAFGDDE